MQCLPVKNGRQMGFSIKRIAHQGMAGKLHMHPDLMSSPCFKTTFYQADRTAMTNSRFKAPVMGNRRFP